MQNKAEIEIITATTIGRISLVRLLPQIRNIRHLVTVQGGKLPNCCGLIRRDLSCIEVSGHGLARNRNHGLRHSEGEFLLFSDDDLILNHFGVCALARMLIEDNSIDFAIGYRQERAPTDRNITRVTLFNCGRVAAPMFMVRRKSIMRTGVKFDTSFGVGADHPIGEDYIFITDLIKAGLKGVHVPVICGSHQGTSSGGNWQDESLLIARRHVLRRVFPQTSGIVALAYAYKHRHCFNSIRQLARFLLS